MIPFNRPAPIGDELTYLAQAASSSQTSGDGPFTKRCHALLQEALGVPHALLTTSCTHALEMAALLLRIQPGDEVIVPSFTFVSTANAFALRGARIVFADVRPDTLNLDERLLPSLITPRTRAIVPVHYAGVACELDHILATAAQHNIAVVEDNAHGLFGKYRGQWLGTFGQLATQSFHETKNFACGEGGALLINDPDLHERAEIIREKGTDRSKFFRGQINKYGWVDLGSSYLPSDLLAAFLLAQLEARAKIQAARKSIWEDYNTKLSEHFVRLGARTPVIPEHCDQSYHMFYLLMPDLDTRTRFISHMKSRGVLTVFHYLPLNASTFGATFGGRPGQCPVTEDVSDRLVRLPLFHDMTADERAQILAAALDFNA
jgi:dTDP-4-amino-4,6-dideoxygalactose transaminase